MARDHGGTPKWATLVVLATVGTALAVAVNPGFVMRISQAGLDYGNWCLSSLLSLKSMF